MESKTRCNGKLDSVECGGRLDSVEGGGTLDLMGGSGTLLDSVGGGRFNSVGCLLLDPFDFHSKL